LNDNKLLTIDTLEDASYSVNKRYLQVMIRGGLVDVKETNVEEEMIKKDNREKQEESKTIDYGCG